MRVIPPSEKVVPKDQEIHIILDNYSAHKHERCSDGSNARGGSSSTSPRRARRGSNLVERFFSTLTEKRIRRGVYTSVAHLERCLKDYLEAYNHDPTPLVWTKSAGEILEKVDRARRAMAAAAG